LSLRSNPGLELANAFGVWVIDNRKSRRYSAEHSTKKEAGRLVP